MAYVKTENPGQIHMDLPTANYIYELPLLSFGDLHGTMDLSLIYSRQMKAEGGDPYYIANGYKLNVQKRLIVADDVPIELREANGNSVDVLEETLPSGLSDNSQRILRSGTNSFILENPDGSKEAYDPNGRITAVFDKYDAQNAVMTYTYDTAGKLIAFAYRGKTVQFIYGNALLVTVSYQGHNTHLGRTGDTLTVSHYSGSVYQLTNSGNDFSATADGSGNGVRVTMPQSNSDIANSCNKAVITRLAASAIVDETTYEFPAFHASASAQWPQVEVTDYYGVKTRMQYQDRTLLYSYEVTGTDVSFTDGKHTGSVHIHASANGLKNLHTAGVFTDNDGKPMTFEESNNRWTYDATLDGYSAQSGYYVVTGWAHKNNANDPGGGLHISGCAYGNDHCDLNFPDATNWIFFTHRLGGNANIITVTQEDDNQIELADVRVLFHSNNLSETAGKHTAVSEEVLIYQGANGMKYIPVYTAKIRYGDATFPYVSSNQPMALVYLADLMKYMINQKKHVNTTEFYYHEGSEQKILCESATAKVMIDETEVELCNCDLGVRQYSPNGVITTRIRDNDSNAFLVYETMDAGGTILSSQTLNEFQDVVSATADGVTTTYVRDRDWILSETVKKTANNDLLYTRTTEYSEDNDTVTVTDEFNNRTVYTFDPVWGTLKTVTLPDGSVVADTYDDDGCAMTKRTFGSAGDRAHDFTYSNGNLTKLQMGNLYYNFGYGGGKLTGVQRNSVQMERHVHSKTSTVSYYPHGGAPLHTVQTYFDKYGRVTSITGVLANTYDVKPNYSDTGALIVSGNNGDALLATTTDMIRGEKTYFGYYPNGSLANKLVTDANDYSDQISAENFTYDKLQRLKKHTAMYDVAAGKMVSSEITYTKGENNMSADNAVSSYTYKVDGIQKAVSGNDFDEYKRLETKTAYVGNTLYAKNFNYNKTRLQSVTETAAGAPIGTISYNYDANGRIRHITEGNKTTRYTYDSYGQLIREDNQALDKSYRYVYNSVGSLTSVETYAYTTAALVTPQSTLTFGCTNERLTSFGGATISYDTMGQPTTYEGKTATWSKGRLSKLSQGTLATGLRNYTYSYNAFGQRVSRNYTYAKEIAPDQTVVSGELLQAAHRYSYDHFGRLIRETCTRNYRGEGSQTETMVFLYDETGVIGMEYALNGSGGIYYFRRNPQGDVVGIYDMFGVRVASYVYDAWGNCTIGSGTTNTAVANANPFRYRGYYYDSDTGLYFCNARYYSPKWRRFISPDSTYYIDHEAVNGLNLYAYCNNDPVNYVDPSGYSAILITLGIMAVGGLIGAAVSATSSALVQLAINGEINWRSVGIAAASGFVSGAIAASPLGLPGQMIAGGIIGGASYIADCYVNDTAITLDGAILSIGMGVLSGWIGGPGANENNALTNSVLQLKKAAMREARRANQAYAQKAMASITSYVHNTLSVTTWGSSIRFAAGCGISNALTGIYAKHVFLNLPSWKPWE